MKSNTYLRFLHLAQAIQGLPGFPKLDGTEERILNICADAWYRNKKITVTGLAPIIPGVSERTSYRRIKDLEKKGMITLKSDISDKRIKLVEPTTLCESYFEQMSTCFSNALKGGGR